MMQSIKYALAAAMLGGLIAAPGAASAMPNGLSALAQTQASDVQDVRWVCGPYRCWWRPSFYRGFRTYVRRTATTLVGTALGMGLAATLLVLMSPPAWFIWM